MGTSKRISRLVILAIFLPRLLFPDAFTQFDEQRWVFRANDAMEALFTGNLSATGSLGYPAVTTMATIAPVIVLYKTVVGLSGHTDSWSLIDQHNVIVWSRLAIGLVTGFLALLLFWLFKHIPLLNKNPWVPAAIVIALANEPWLLGMSRVMIMDSYISFFLLISLVAAFAYRYEADKRFLVLSGVAFGLGFITKSTISFFGPFLLVPYINASWKRSYRQILAWVGVGSVTIFIFWPAMWVHPILRINELLFWNSYHALDLNEPLYWPGIHPPFAIAVLSVYAFTGLVAYISFRIYDGYKLRNVPGIGLTDTALVMGVGFQTIMAYAVADRSRWILPAISLFSLVGVVGLYRILNVKLNSRVASIVIICVSVLTSGYLFPYPTLSLNPIFYSTEATWQLGMGEGSRQLADYLAHLPTGSVISTKIPSLLDRYMTYSNIEVTRFPESNILSEVSDDTTHLALPMAQNRALFEPSILPLYEWMNSHEPEYVVTLRGIPLYGVYKYAN